MEHQSCSAFIAPELLRTQLLCDRGVKEQRFNYVAAADENPWLQELDLEDGKAGKCQDTMLESLAILVKCQCQ